MNISEFKWVDCILLNAEHSYLVEESGATSS